MSNKEKNLCECTSPQPQNGKTWCNDNMCMCGFPTHNDYDWTNDSGYSDVFHNEYTQEVINELLDEMKTHDLLVDKYIAKYEKELRELTDKELKNNYIGWFCNDYKIEELEKVERNEMIYDMIEDKKTYLKGYEIEELKDYIK